jgi:hypothetical protein
MDLREACGPDFASKSNLLAKKLEIDGILTGDGLPTPLRYMSISSCWVLSTISASEMMRLIWSRQSWIQATYRSSHDYLTR